MSGDVIDLKTGEVLPAAVQRPRYEFGEVVRCLSEMLTQHTAETRLECVQKFMLAHVLSKEEAGNVLALLKYAERGLKTELAHKAWEEAVARRKQLAAETSTQPQGGRHDTPR